MSASTSREASAVDRPTAGERPALWRHLWVWTFGAVLAVWITLVAVALSTGFREARKFIDGHLVAVAHLWVGSAPGLTPATRQPASGVDDEYIPDLAVLAWTDGRLDTDTHSLAPGIDLARLTRPGLSDVVYTNGNGPRDWRAYVVEQTVGERVRRVAVLIDKRERSALGLDIAEHVALPALLLLPLVALVLWWTIRRGLRPLERLSREVAELDVAAGQRLNTEHRHREFVSTVSAINTLVHSLQTQAQREREFASDVAHELRTPLAAITLQAGAAQYEPTPERLAQLEQESLRAGRILAQLLDLARAQRNDAEAAPSGTVADVDITEIATQLVARHAPLGHASGHELSLQTPEAPVRVRASPMLLELALRNLIANALRHTPGGTQIAVEVWRHGGTLGVSVSDDGQRPGAPALNPARGQGNGAGLGLGLRLVERMAEQMGAQLERSAGTPPMTTCFTLRWPASAGELKTPAAT
jgi:two-component system sensor histidine kinase QseC